MAVKASQQITIIDVADGKDGSSGADGKTSYIHIAYANSSDGKTGFSITDSADKLYIGQYTDFSSTDSTDYTKYSWTKIKGEQGIQGATGDKGDKGADGTSVTISSKSVTYQASSSGTTIPTGTWQTSVPSVNNGQYLWAKTVVTYSTGDSTTSYSVGYKGTNGSNGTNGTNGTNGKDGKGIKSTAIAYQVGTSGTTAPTGTWQTAVQATTAAGQYLWTRTITTYTDSTSITTYSVSAHGATGSKGATGESVKTITTYYLATSASSGVTTSTSGWGTDVKTMTSTNKYLWSYSVTKGSNGTTLATTSPCIIGAYGDKGATGSNGATGTGISSITQLYYASSSSSAPSAPTATVTTNSTSTYNAWNKALPTYSASYPYYYTCTEVLYTDNTRKWTSVVYDGALTTANQTAASANSTANTANTNASKAVSTANTANTTANTANTTANAAKTAAATAQTTANNAAKTATNFLEYNSTDGLIVGNKTSGSWSGTRAQIKSDSYNILDSSGNQLASFGTAITLGTRYEGSTVGVGSIAIGDGDVIASGARSLAVGGGGYIAALSNETASVTNIYYNNDGSSYSVAKSEPRVDSEIYNREIASGDNSISLGSGNTASGLDSCCLGVGNTASGVASFAQGNSNKASGMGSFAIGKLTIASGNYSFCGGRWGYNKKSDANIQSKASSDYSFVFGAGNNSTASYGVCFGLGNTVIGEGAVALGMYNYVTGIFSLSSGYNTSVSGNYSFASGYETTASGNSSFALGNGAIASGSYSFCGGNSVTIDETKYPNKAIGQSSFVYGAGNEVSGNGSVAFGCRNIIDENSANSICVGESNAISHESLCSGTAAIGYNNTASGNHAAAIGCNNTASEVGSVAIGYNVKASHQCSVALNGDTTTSAMYQTVIGCYNKDDSNARFIIGNGTSSARSNAFTVSNAGVATATGGFVGNLTGSLSGNASTATTLQTARTINGTSFNGSGNITTANWGTARTITIGNKGKSVNGSGNVSWSLSEIGAAAASHTHSYLPLSGGTMSGTISSSKTTSTYLAGNQGNAIINSTASAGSYTMLAKMNSTNGYFTHGTYQTRYELHYTAASTVTAGTNAITYDATLLDESGNSVFPGSLWSKVTGTYGRVGVTNSSSTSPSSDSSSRGMWLELDSSGNEKIYARNGSSGLNCLIANVSYGRITLPKTVISGDTTINGNLSVSINYKINGISFDTSLNMTLPANLYVPYNILTTGGYLMATQCKNNNTTAAPNAYWASNGISGYLLKTSTTSSRRYKEDITEILDDELNPESLYDVPVVQFKYTKEHFTNKEDIRYRKNMIGLIAEDVYDKYKIAADYHVDEETGEVLVDGWNNQYLIPAMLKLIQNQHKQIEELEIRMDLLENKLADLTN